MRQDRTVRSRDKGRDEGRDEGQARSRSFSKPDEEEEEEEGDRHQGRTGEDEVVVAGALDGYQEMPLARLTVEHAHVYIHTYTQ